MQDFPYIEHLRQQGMEQGLEKGMEQGLEKGMEQGLEQGARDTSIKVTLSVLTKRFPLQDVQPVRNALESIEDLDHLSELHLMSIDTNSVEEFLRALSASDE